MASEPRSEPCNPLMGKRVLGDIPLCLIGGIVTLCCLLQIQPRKAIHVKYAWKNFKVLEDLLSFTPSKVGSINSSHRIFVKHHCKHHFMYTSWISLEQKGIIYFKNVYQSHRKGRWNMKKCRGKFKGLGENETSTKQEKQETARKFNVEA